MKTGFALGPFLLVPKLHLGTRLSPKLRFAKLAPVRSRYHINEPCAAHFVTATIVAWLPVFTTAERCDILIQSLEYCRAHKDLRIHAWVILDNHFHAILAAPHLSRVLADLKRHQFRHFRAAYKVESTYQIWQEGSHPQAIVSDEIMLQKLEYLHNNPVKRGLVAVPEALAIFVGA